MNAELANYPDAMCWYGDKGVPAMVPRPALQTDLDSPWTRGNPNSIRF